MNNSQGFDLAALKKMSVDKLIEKCRDYVEQYVSPNDGTQFDQAYRDKNYEKVIQFLAKTRKRVESGLKRADLKRTRDITIQEFPDAETLFDDTVKNRGRRRSTMVEFSSGIGNETGSEISNGITGEVGSEIGSGVTDEVNSETGGGISSGMIAVIVIIVTMLFVIAIKRNADKRRAKETLPKYTEKDSDMLELVHQLSTIYQTTDEYLKS